MDWTDKEDSMGSCFPVNRLFYNILLKREAIWPWIHAPIPVIEICVPPKLLWLVSWSGRDSQRIPRGGGGVVVSFAGAGRQWEIDLHGPRSQWDWERCETGSFFLIRIPREGPRKLHTVVTIKLDTARQLGGGESRPINRA